jgi:hypothetical protein
MVNRREAWVKLKRVGGILWNSSLYSKEVDTVLG